jgi:hypothetical protein
VNTPEPGLRFLLSVASRAKRCPGDHPQDVARLRVPVCDMPCAISGHLVDCGRSQTEGRMDAESGVVQCVRYIYAFAFGRDSEG